MLEIKKQRKGISTKREIKVNVKVKVNVKYDN